MNAEAQQGIPAVHGREDVNRYEVPPGWYPDPAAPETRRYWDGEQWLEEPEQDEQDVPRWAPGAPPTPTARTFPTIPGPPTDGPAPARYPLNPARLAPPGVRAAARFIDLITILLLNVAVNGWLIVLYLREAWPVADAWARAVSEGREAPSLELSDRGQQLGWVVPLVASALWFAYEVPATANSGQTLGKRMLGIRVLRADDQLLSFGQSLRRWIILWLPSPLVSFLCGLPLALADLLWCLWDRPARQCLHDKAVFSIVVRTERATAAGGSGTAGAPGP